MDEDEDLLKYYKPPTATPAESSPSAPAGGEEDDLSKYYRPPSAQSQAFGFNRLPGYESEVSAYKDPEAERKQQTIDTLKDVGASAATRFPIGVVAGTVGTPGTLEEVGRSLPSVGVEKATDFLVRQGFITPRTQEQMVGAANQPSLFDLAAMAKQALLDKYVPSVGSALREGQEAGYVSRSGLPTYEGVSAAMKKVAPFLGYESKTGPGEYAGEAAETAGQFIVGPLKGAAGRTFLGVGTGLGAKAGEKLAEDQNFDPATGKLLGTVSGLSLSALGLKGARYLPGRTAPAKEDLAKTIDSYSMESTVPARRLAEGPDLTKVRDLTSQRTGEFLGKLTQEGTPLSASRYQGKIAAETADETSRLYELSKQHPQAQSISPRQFADLEKYPVFMDAIEQAKKDAITNPDFNIVVPQPARSQVVKGPNGQPLLDASGNPVVSQTQEIPGNLAFYNQVYKNLGRTIRAEKRADAPRDVILTSATSTKEALGKRLDDLVPSYKDARNAHIEAIGATNSVEAGYDFLKNMPELKQGQIVSAVERMSPLQREGFAYGIMQNIQDQIAAGNIGSVVKQMTMKPIYRERLELALGPEKFDQLRGKVLGENLISQASNLQQSMVRSGARGISDVTGAGVLGGMALVGTEAIQTANQILMSTIGMAPGVAGKAIAGAVAGVTSKALYNAAERAVAQKMLPLITQGTPESFAKLSRMMDESRAAKIVYDKLYHTTGILARQMAEDQAAEGEQKAYGGRTGRATGGRVGVDVEADALVRAADRAKKDFNRTTEPLLNAPDNHIAKALEVANKAI
jgi:hypothetical protein